MPVASSYFQMSSFPPGGELKKFTPAVYAKHSILIGRHCSEEAVNFLTVLTERGVSAP